MIAFLIKGLWRDRTRSLFPFITVVTGVVITVIMQTYMAGIISNMSWSSASFSTGHVKVTSRAYAKEGEQASNELAYAGLDKLLGDLRRQAPELIWSPRIRFGGLLDIPDDQGRTKAQAPIAGLGVDLLSSDAVDRRVLNVEGALVRGRLPASRGEILISDELARELDVQPGATATLISSTMYGSMATSNFTIAGTIRLGIRAMDRGTVMADVADLQAALDMPDAAGEILGFFPDTLYRRQSANAIAERFNGQWSGIDGEFAPVMVSMSNQPGAAELIDYMGAVSTGVVAIFTFVMSIVLWNAGLIGSLRRYGEIGVRLAFGEDKGHLYRAMIAESLVIGFVGSVVGTALAMGPAYWLQSTGFDMSALMPNSSLMANNIIRAQISAVSFFIGFLPGLLATSIGTAFSGIGVYKRQTATLMKELET